MFDLTYSSEPVVFRGANRSPSLCPQPISHHSYDIFTWRTLVRVSHGRTEIRRHRAPFVLPEMALKVARPEQTGTARGEEDGTTAACSAAH
jgi:hypothetical protein